MENYGRDMQHGMYVMLGIAFITGLGVGSALFALLRKLFT